MCTIHISNFECIEFLSFLFLLSSFLVRDLFSTSGQVCLLHINVNDRSSSKKKKWRKKERKRRRKYISFPELPGFYVYVIRFIRLYAIRNVKHKKNENVFFFFSRIRFSSQNGKNWNNRTPNTEHNIIIVRPYAQNTQTPQSHTSSDWKWICTETNSKIHMRMNWAKNEDKKEREKKNKINKFHYSYSVQKKLLAHTV